MESLQGCFPYGFDKFQARAAAGACVAATLTRCWHTTAARPARVARGPLCRRQRADRQRQDPGGGGGHRGGAGGGQAHHLHHAAQGALQPKAARVPRALRVRLRYSLPFTPRSADTPPQRVPRSMATVGLKTGDAAINPDARVVVMTTEILRNILYRSAGGTAGDGALADVGLVVLDEVHYLSDMDRGTVWEEVRAPAATRWHASTAALPPPGCPLPASDARLCCRVVRHLLPQERAAVVSIGDGGQPG